MSILASLSTNEAPLRRRLAAAVRAFWSNHAGRLIALAFPRSLRIRLVAIVLVIDCLAAVLTGSVIVLKARTATKAEIASSTQLAEMLVAETIRLLHDTPAPVLLKSIDLHFQSIRHVKIVVTDDAGQPIEAPLSPNAYAMQNTRGSEAPAWFYNLVAPPIETKDFPIIIHHQRVGVVAVRSEPGDEISEAWDYAYALLLTASCLNIVTLAVLFLLFGRALAPLTRLVSGLKNLESKNYAVRLPRPSLLELAIITDHFNCAAEALLAAQAANRQLDLKLLTAQDDERRHMALELHDEAGPCLFALEANATSIASMAQKLPDGALVRERALDIVGLVERIQGINRRVLDSLRPMALGQIPLEECLIKLLVDLDDGDAKSEIDYRISDLRESYGVVVDLTIYRCVQEGLLNAIRHAQATRITLTLGESRELGIPVVALLVEDDGIGSIQPLRAGFGLSGMRERVEALRGSFELCTSPGGTALAIFLPLQDEEFFTANSKPFIS